MIKPYTCPECDVRRPYELHKKGCKYLAAIQKSTETKSKALLAEMMDASLLPPPSGVEGRH